MSILADLREQLRVMEREITAVQQWGDPAAMQKVHRGIQVNFGGLSMVTNQVAIEDAVLEFRQSGKLERFKETKYVSFGCASPWGDDEFRIIESESLFKSLLEYVLAYKREPRKYALCYQGLLLGYLSYPVFRAESLNGKTNWHLLRVFLAEGIDILNLVQPSAMWAAAVTDHSNLFGDAPCRRYAERMLDGDASDFDRMVEVFGLAGRMTWVHEQTLLSQIESACEKPDAVFLPLISRMLEILERLDDLKSLKHRGLAMVLTRYKRCEDPVEHEELRDLALAEWKNPWLAVNEVEWLAWVDQPVREMVTTWMKARYIQDFFSLLQADGAADRRRLAFWLRYVEQIDDMYFALGRSSYFSRRPDYKALRERMSGRLMRLESPSQHNNAFLMVIGGNLFIEYGEQNNACYVFRNGEGLPFQLGQTTVSDNQYGLKGRDSTAFVDRLYHTDGHQTWERKFSSRIASLSRSSPPIQNSTLSRLREEPVETSSGDGASVKPRSPEVTMAELRKFADRYDLKIEDKRENGGNLWIFLTHKSSTTIDYALKFWGFRYAAKRNGWYRE